ncbi:MAG: hypothetical protein JG718_05240 [Candidatus Thiothrix moscowensis]|nr:hypothetical protein [Candidatus Thiothrix moscowensis]
MIYVKVVQDVQATFALTEVVVNGIVLVVVDAVVSTSNSSGGFKLLDNI